MNVSGKALVMSSQVAITGLPGLQVLESALHYGHGVLEEVVGHEVPLVSVFRDRNYPS